MKKQILQTLIFILLVSCGQNKSQQQTQGQENQLPDSISILNDPKVNLNIQTCTFSEIDSSGILIFPLSMGEKNRGKGSASYKEMPDNEYWNIIFYNSNTQDYHLLSERKMIIVNFDYTYESEYNNNISPTTNHIFYIVRTDDSNKDKKLTDEDPQYLFVSDKFGYNFRQISPIGYNLNNWKFIKKSNKVIMVVGKDSDNNYKFDDSDEITTFEIELNKGTEAKEIFTNDFKSKLKVLFDRDWKRIKK